MAPGTHPHAVRSETITIDPHPLSSTARGGKMMQRRTRPQPIAISKEWRYHYTKSNRRLGATAPNYGMEVWRFGGLDVLGKCLERLSCRISLRLPKQPEAVFQSAGGGQGPCDGIDDT